MNSDTSQLICLKRTLLTSIFIIYRDSDCASVSDLDYSFERSFVFLLRFPIGNHWNTIGTIRLLSLGALRIPGALRILHLSKRGAILLQ